MLVFWQNPIRRILSENNNAKANIIGCTHYVAGGTATPTHSSIVYQLPALMHYILRTSTHLYNGIIMALGAALSRRLEDHLTS